MELIDRIILSVLGVGLILTMGYATATGAYKYSDEVIIDTVYMKDFKQQMIIDSLQMELYNCDVELAQTNFNLSTMDKIITTLISGTESEKEEIEEHYSLELLK